MTFAARPYGLRTSFFDPHTRDSRLCEHVFSIYERTARFGAPGSVKFKRITKALEAANYEPIDLDAAVTEVTVRRKKKRRKVATKKASPPLAPARSRDPQRSQTQKRLAPVSRSKRDRLH